jgi:hypothetical protein
MSLDPLFVAGGPIVMVTGGVGRLGRRISQALLLGALPNTIPQQLNEA